MFRPVYKNDYYRDPENNDQDVLPLRWIPWEVYVMVSKKFPKALLQTLKRYFLEDPYFSLVELCLAAILGRALISLLQQNPV